MAKRKAKSAAEESKAGKRRRGVLIDDSRPESQQMCDLLSSVLLTAVLTDDHRSHLRRVMEYIARQAGHPMAEDHKS